MLHAEHRIIQQLIDDIPYSIILYMATKLTSRATLKTWEWPGDEAKRELCSARVVAEH